MTRQRKWSSMPPDEKTDVLYRETFDLPGTTLVVHHCLGTARNTVVVYDKYGETIKGVAGQAGENVNTVTFGSVEPGSRVWVFPPHSELTRVFPVTVVVVVAPGG